MTGMYIVLSAALAGAPPGLHVTTATTGDDLPASGCQADIWRDDGGSRLYITSIALPVNGTVTVPDLAPNTYYSVDFVAPPTCHLMRPAGQDLYLGGPSDPGVTVEFDVNCALPSTRLAFATTNDPNSEIYVINTDGTGAAAITNDPAYDAAPAWSPDGTKIAFQSDRGRAPEIYVMNADGSNPVQITSTGSSFRPAWSPDGTRIAFTSLRDGNSEIYVVNADGTGLANLTNNPANDANPAWSPDGTKIAFDSDRNGFGCIYLMNPDGSGAARLTADTWITDSQPSWSPDGQQLAISRFWCADLCMQTIWAMSAVDGSARAVTMLINPDCEMHTEPAWSPDGSDIAYTHTDLCFGGPTTVNFGGQQEAGSNASWRPPARSP